MISIPLSLVSDTPMSAVEHLAREESLLEACDAGELGGMLRFWEPQEQAVVVGYANSVLTETRLQDCDRDGVRVLRRCSGGGTVMQMPGVLNYTLVTPLPEDGPLSTVGGTNTWMMTRLKDALARIDGLSDRLSIRGITDLCLGEKKFVGSAQRRKRSALLFHGSILLEAPLELMERYLAFPTHQPDYRESRSHLEFCCNLEKPAAAVKAALLKAWDVSSKEITPPRERMERLLRERYYQATWHRKW